MRRTITIFALLACICAGAQESLSLKECLEMCGSNNPEIRNSRLDVLSSQALKSELTWEYFPTVSLGGISYYAGSPLLRIGLKDILGTSDMAWELNNRITAFTNENGIRNHYDLMGWGYGVSLIATQPVYAGGRIRSGNRLARLGIEAADLQADIKLRDTRLETERKYWRVVALQEKMTTLRKAKSVIDSLYARLCSARDAGLALESDVAQVRSRRTELLSGEIALKGGMKLAKMDLFNSIGLKYEYLKLDDYILTEAIGEPVSPDKLLGGETSDPTELRLLDAQVEARKLEKKVSIGEYLPEVALGASYGYGNLVGRSNTDPGSKAIGFATVKIPLTGIGKAVTRARRYDYEIQKAMNEKEWYDSQLVLQRRQLFLAAETAFSQAGVAREALMDARDRERRCRAEYQAGRTTISELLQAELASRTAAEDYIDRCIDYRLAVSDYTGRYGSPAE